MSRWVVGGLLFLALMGLAVGASSYSITAEPGIDTPDTTVQLEGSTFTVRGIAAVPPGETITASITVPDDNDGYRVYVYGTVDGAREIIDSKYASSGSNVAFETSSFDPGLYTFALHTDGDYQAVYPFIVTGATVEISAPDTVSVGESVTLDADVTPTAPAVDIGDVEFVVFGNDVQKRVTATAAESGYTATIETDDLPAGEYTVYAVALNASQTATGNLEPIGLSAQQSLTIEAQPTKSGGQQQTTTTTPDETPPENTTTATTVTATTTMTTVTTTTTSATTATGTTSAATETSPPETTAGTSTTDSDVLTPNPTTTTSTSAPGFSVSASAVAILTVVVFRLRQT